MSKRSEKLTSHSEKKSVEPGRKKKAKRSGLSTGRAIVVIYMLIFGGVMLYGSFAWRYAPIRQVGGQYVDKRGTIHSAEDYRRFLFWETLVFTMAFGGIAVGFAAPVIGKLLKSRTKASTNKDGE